MPIEVYTGQPGNGKTALAMERLLNEAKKGERPIYAAGIEGLDAGLAVELEDPTKWNEQDEDGNYLVPDGSLIFIDEAWKWFGHLHNASKQATPKHVLDLAEHRHRGLDFIWTTQQANQIYPFARGLVGIHHHVVRRYGTAFIDVFTWGSLIENTKSQSARSTSQRVTRRLPKHVFGKYKSASIHTIKAKIPLRVYLLILAVLGLCFIGYRLYSRFTAHKSTDTTVLSTAHAFPVKAASSVSRGIMGGEEATRAEPLTQGEYALLHLPRFGTMPWSAPVFDERPTTVDPQLFCMSSEAGKDGQGKHKPAGCNCLTEQGTRYDLPIADCIQVARHGQAYNPYKATGLAVETRQTSLEQ